MSSWRCTCGANNATRAKFCEACGAEAVSPAAAPRASSPDGAGEPVACAGTTGIHPCPLRGRILQGGRAFCAYHFAYADRHGEELVFEEFDRWRVGHANTCSGWTHWTAGVLWDFLTGRLKELPAPHACSSGWPSCPYAAEPTRGPMRPREIQAQVAALAIDRTLPAVSADDERALEQRKAEALARFREASVPGAGR